MFNADKPSLDQLPTTTQLIRSTIIAGLSALTILLTVILPAEYGIDPTGIGRGLGLTEMGEIKKQLAEEAEADRQLETSQGQQSNLWPNFLGLFISTAHAADAESWRDTATFTLKPGDTAEWKLTMERGQNAEYQMLVEGGRVNFDLHGHGSGKSITYEKGRGSTGSKGAFSAEFDGEHGWFWRNRDKVDVIVTIKVRGEHAAFNDRG